MGVTNGNGYTLTIKNIRKKEGIKDMKKRQIVVERKIEL